ncbi:MAG: HAD family hydrolase [Lentisphaeria bacterium]|nr:HAD family hydrolase [Lentisphaeria bacterium]
MLLTCPSEPLPGGVELVTPFEPREIAAAFHDIDGTHSKIREWIPVMTLVTGSVAAYGMFRGTPAEIAGEIRRHRGESFPEARRFAVESAGLSALTQMEWALRMARRLDGKSGDVNERIIDGIWKGEETFGDTGESPDDLRILGEQASLLFRAYEILLLEMGRNANLSAARKDPRNWRIPGSLAFLRTLKAHGVENYFITGAVVEYDGSGVPSGTMCEEIRALGYQVGKGKLLEEICGSAWNEKSPKIDIMKNLMRRKKLSPEQVLVVGDGRSEIAAGRALGCLTVSRLDICAERAREIHRRLKTNLIVPDFRAFDRLFSSGSSGRKPPQAGKNLRMGTVVA